MSFPRYPKYKDSGVKWMGEVPEHWGVSQSRRLFAVRNEPAAASDKQLTASQVHGVIYQEDFVRLEGRRVVEVIKGADSLKHVEPNDFVISMRSFQGGIEWCKLNGSISWHYVMLVPVKNVHPPFFAHLFKSLTYIQALRATTDLIRDGQELRYSHFAQVDLPLVPIEEQETIASFLDSETAKLDELVAEQQRLIELLNEKRQAVISHVVTKGLNPDAPMKHSGVEWLGEVPAHWDVAPVSSRYHVQLGKMLDSKKISGEHLRPYLRAFDVQWGRINTEDLPRMDFDEDDRAKFLLSPGDLLVNEGGTPGRSAIWQGFVEECYYQKALHRLRPHSADKDTAEFMYFVMAWAVEQGVFAAGGNETTIEHLPAEKLRRHRFGFPPLEEQRTITRVLEREVGKLDALTSEAQRAIELLQERRAALISAAVTGQIDVRAIADRVAA